MVAHIIYANMEVVISFIVVLMMGFIGSMVSNEKNEVAIFNVAISGFIFYNSEYLPLWYFVMIVAGVTIYAVQQYKGVIMK